MFIHLSTGTYFQSMHDVGFLIDRVDVFGMFQAQVIMSALVHYL